MKILMVLTSHDRLGDTGKPTGFWLEEFAAPYYAFKDADEEVALASKDVQDRLAELGAVATTMSPSEFGTFIEAEIKRWAPVVKESGAKPE